MTTDAGRQPTKDTTRAFESERSHLFAVAYRMLGSASEADDVLQEAFLRFAETTAPIDSTRAYLTTVVVRLSLDQLKSARARREVYVGPWLPEPLVSSQELPPGPDARTELAESLSIAFLVLLERRLSPLERAAFLLREVFDQPFGEVASALGTSEVACRQLVSRARAQVDENRPRFQASDAKKQELLAAFQWIGELAWVNGEPGFVIRTDDGAQTVLTLSVVGDAISDVWIVVNPDKLRWASVAANLGE